MFPAGLGEVPAAAPADVVEPAPNDSKVNDFSMFLSILSSLVLILRN